MAGSPKFPTSHEVATSPRRWSGNVSTIAKLQMAIRYVTWPGVVFVVVVTLMLSCAARQSHGLGMEAREGALDGPRRSLKALAKIAAFEGRYNAAIAPQCESYYVPEPAAYGSLERAELAAQLLPLLKQHGPHGVIQNGTYLAALRRLTQEDRERLSFDSHSTAIYLDEEVAAFQKREEDAVLKAAPPGYALPQLIGVNVGVGGRVINDVILPLDIHRGHVAGLPEAQRTPQHTFLAWGDQLPFAPESLDFIISLHNLEHLHDPVKAVLHYLSLLKPGGGLGVVIPHWRYAWDASHDRAAWGHRWNTSPELVCSLHAR